MKRDRERERVKEVEKEEITKAGSYGIENMCLDTIPLGL